MTNKTWGGPALILANPGSLEILRDPPWLGQRQIAPVLLPVGGHERSSEGLRALRRDELDLERIATAASTMSLC